jgi:hypothetical protein
MIADPYTVDSIGLARYIVAKHFPERSDREDAVILAFIAAHGDEFEQWTFSRRVGEGLAPDPSHLPAVQKNTLFGTRKRIDMLARSGSRWTIIEVKDRVTPASLGQILTYRHLFLEEFPDAEDPGLVVIGRFSDPDTIRSLQANNVAVFLYPTADARGDAAAGSV